MTNPRWRWLLVSILASACSSQRYVNQQLLLAETSFKDHIGFVLYDPVLHKILYDHQGDRYFTPASNTKIFTLYTSLQLLGDSIPSIRYVQRNDSLIFWGTGDPSFLYRNLYDNDRVYNFLKSQSGRLYVSSSNFYEERLGPGWAWDDYGYAYQVERTSFPMYGNLVNLKVNGDSMGTIPSSFKRLVSTSSPKNERPEMIREIGSNQFTFSPGVSGRRKEWNIPFCYSDTLLAKLLSDTLKREVKNISMPISPDAKILYSVPADSLYKVMMQESDNFIAEQLLLICSNKLSDSLRAGITINYAKKILLSDLQDEPIWIDGSGLSRYNLFTPRSIVGLWEKMYNALPRERLFPLLAIGGKSGTLKNSYLGETPFIFGKTGTLNNNHALSGYIVTRKGTTLIFSWMNNNFTRPTSEVRSTMETVLRRIYEKY